MRREANNADRSHKDRSPATIRSESWTPFHGSKPLQRENRRGRNIRRSRSRRGRIDNDRSHSRSHGRREPGIPRRVAPVAAVVHVEGEPNTPLGSIPATEGAGPATITNGAGKPGSSHATVCMIRGRDVATPGAFLATKRAYSVKARPRIHSPTPR